jgi:DNA (cytosine-5)-methyltransferase 1
LFAGIGGIDIAFKQAGADIIWANEIDKYACSLYRYNFNDNKLIENNICEINSETIPDFDILAAGFPCQPFSVMGKQLGFHDPRGNLFFEITRVIEAKNPSVVFLENVKNLILHDNGRTFITINNLLSELGYNVKYKIMNATEYGNLPQERSRIYIVAFKDKEIFERFDFPEKLSLTVSINDLIDRSIKKSDVLYYKKENKYYKLLNERINDMENIYRIDDSGVAIRAWNPCPTLKANMGTYHDRVPIIRDNFGIRKISPYECLALQGFPKEYRLLKMPLNHIYKAIGNSVPVTVVQRIAEKIIHVLER